MSNKFFKKIRKEARAEVSRKFADGIDVLATMIRPKPRFCPKFIWFVFYMPLFKTNTWKFIYKYIK